MSSQKQGALSIWWMATDHISLTGVPANARVPTRRYCQHEAKPTMLGHDAIWGVVLPDKHEEKQNIVAGENALFGGKSVLGKHGRDFEPVEWGE